MRLRIKQTTVIFYNRFTKKRKIETDELDLSYLNPGIYFLVIGNNINVKKINIKIKRITYVAISFY